MAKVVLEVLDGPGLGGQLWLKEGQRAEVGRAEWVDLAVPEDEALADVQFALECRRGRAWLRQPQPGTWLNGQELARDIGLADGDQIAAGYTLFGLQIIGGSADTEDLPDEPPPPPVEEPIAFNPNLLLAERSFRSGLEEIELQGNVLEQPPDVQHTYVIYLQELGNILGMQGRHEEAADHHKLAEHYLKSPELKRFLSGEG